MSLSVAVKVKSSKINVECGGEGMHRIWRRGSYCKIPAGVAEGMQVTMNGKGNAGKHNGVAGDLLVLIEEEKHPELIRDESDPDIQPVVSVPTAALGGTVEIPTIDGKTKIKIEPGTQPGKVLRVREKDYQTLTVMDTVPELEIYW